MNNPTPPSWLFAFTQAQQLASQGRFDDCLALCQQIVDNHPDDPEAVLCVGNLLSNFGFLSAARNCYMCVSKVVPKDMSSVIGVANIARESGDHAESRRLYAALLGQLPENPIIRRNALTSLEYDPQVSADERLMQASA